MINHHSLVQFGLIERLKDAHKVDQQAIILNDQWTLKKQFNWSGQHLIHLSRSHLDDKYISSLFSNSKSQYSVIDIYICCISVRADVHVCIQVCAQTLLGFLPLKWG